MSRLNIDILGMSEIKWKNEGDFGATITVIYSGDKKSHTGVGTILTKEWGKTVKNSLLFNYRIMLIKLKKTKMTW
jgi:hypothetical protein